MPIKKSVNQDFFKIWSSDMAYVLGFFTADGSMYTKRSGSKYIAFYSNDLEILEKIRASLSSKHKIGKRKISIICPNRRFVLQIGNKHIYENFLNLGLVPNKSRILKFPDVPKKFLKDFVRGYFDGDGNILFKKYFRKDRKKHNYYFATKFICGSFKFLNQLRKKLIRNVNIGGGSLYPGDRSFVLSYAMKDSKRLCEFMYNGVSKDLFLERKYRIYTKALKILENSER